MTANGAKLPKAAAQLFVLVGGAIMGCPENDRFPDTENIQFAGHPIQGGNCQETMCGNQLSGNR
jgi:hypothetical protein